MKIKRLFSAAAAVMVLSVLLTGCGASLKTARIAEKFGNALKAQPATSATAEINCTITTTTQGIPGDTKFHTVVRTRADWDSNRRHSDIDSTVTNRGKDIRNTMQLYSNGESGEQVRYAHLDQYDLWIRLQNQVRPEDVKPQEVLKFLDQISGETTMEMSEDTMGGGIHYILKLTFTGEELRDFADSTGILIPEEFEGCDLKDVTVPVELEIEDKTFLPIRIQIWVRGINDSLVQALAKTFAKGRDAEGQDIDMEEISLLITNFGYDVQDIPMLPKGAAENALDMEKVKEIRNK